jgi:hypothetical protein
LLGPRDAFVAKLSADGGRLDFATFLGGEWFDVAADVAVDSNGAVVVAGATESPDFPTTPDALQKTLAGGEKADGFVARLTPDGAGLTHSTLTGMFLSSANISGRRSPLANLHSPAGAALAARLQRDDAPHRRRRRARGEAPPGPIPEGPEFRPQRAVMREEAPSGRLVEVQAGALQQ